MDEEHTTNKTKTKEGHQPSNAEIMSSAKVIAGAAKSAFAKENEKIDKAEVAEAAADILSAAKKYGKLEDNSYGKVLDKAEDYLHNYHNSNSTTSAVHGGSHKEGGGKEHEHSSSGGGGGGGYGEYMKMAQGFLKKDDGEHDHKDGGGHHDGHSSSGGGAKKDDSKHGGDGDHGHGGGGYGEYVKMAQGFLNK